MSFAHKPGSKRVPLMLAHQQQMGALVVLGCCGKAQDRTRGGHVIRMRLADEPLAGQAPWLLSSSFAVRLGLCVLSCLTVS